MASSRSASGRSRPQRRCRRRSGGPRRARALVLVSVKDQAARPGLVRRALAESRRARRRPRPTRASSSPSFAPARRRDERRVRDPRRQGRRRRRRRPRSRRPIDTNGASDFAAEPGPKAALDATTDDHVGFVYIALRPLARLVERPIGTRVGARRLAIAGISARSSSSSRLDRLPAPRRGRRPRRWTATAPDVETRLGPTDEPTSTVVDHVPAPPPSRRWRVGNDLGRRLEETLDPYRTSRPQGRSSTSRRRTGLLGGLDAHSAGSATPASSSTHRTATPEGGLVIDPDRSGQPPTAVHGLRSLHLARRRAASASPSATRPTAAPRSRPSTSASSPTWPGWPAGCGGPRRPAGSPAGHVRARLRGRPTRSSSSASGPAFVKPCSTPTPAPRSPSNAALPGRSSAGSAPSAPAWRSSTSTPSATSIETPSPMADRATSAPSTRTDVKPFLDAVRRARRDERRRGRPGHAHHHHHRQVGRDAPASRHRGGTATHGSPHPADARRRDEAADLSRRRRRRPQRPRRAIHRDARPLQPAHRAGRVRGRRRQGQGVAGEGRSAVRHRRPPVPQAGILPAAK